MTARLLLPELLAARGWTVYRLLREAGSKPYQGRLVGGNLDPSWAYRVARNGGAFDNITPARIQALCDTLGCAPRDLFEPAPRRHR